MSSATRTDFPPPPAALDERIGQLLMVRIGSNLPPVQTAADDEQRMTALLGDVPVGGLLLFNGGTNAKGVLARLQDRSPVPLLVASDIERGVGQQVQGATLFPHAMAFERLGVDGAASVGEFARLLAHEARNVGIHITFGPVADVNTNPRNPIIATRAFSAQADRAAELVATYVRAAEDAGLATTPKHFPGHGDTQQDSHDSLPSVTRSLAELMSCELLPFQAAIEARCSLVMTAHVAFPQLDPSGLPATLSPTILNEVLRKSLRFEGVVCSDSLLMAGVRDRFANEGELALATLRAGVDLLLDVRNPGEVVRFLVAAVESGELAESRVDQALERVWALKQKVFGTLAQSALAGDAQYRHGAGVEFSARVARRAITTIGEQPCPALPLDTSRPLVALLLKPFSTSLDPPEQALGAALKEHFRDVTYCEIGPDAPGEELAEAGKLAGSADQLLVAMIVKPAAWHAFGLLPAQQELVRQLVERRELVLASLGVPYAFREYGEANCCICTYSDVPVSQQALASFIAGAEY